ncbi:F-box/LRR-repeat protein 25-like [Aegilops tauschii subsp. strangulata]|uniref:F-box domain-containing protein n=2 Tax=Aegilops tauschii TaxID=37682 RepID=A0A453DHM0_AEGTS|nr:F-box/FBD/LRR-repeat protein At5g22660-like [Aegilops tauschii subsp. strangulata]
MSAPTSIPCGSKSAGGNGNGVDRLSSLSDDLLHHVMSFLPMPEVVRTSLLSPRWRFLWCSTPFICIDGEDFVDQCKLEKFGDRLLLLRDGTISLDEARIHAYRADSATCSAWIRHAIMHKVRLLHISGFLRLDSTAMFPSRHLKIIRLQSVTLKHGLFRPLNYDCPVLEHLELELCSVCGHEEISSSSLKVLDISHCLIISSLLICARNLTHISILHPYAGAIVTRDLSSLVTALINLRSKSFHHMGTVMDHHLLDGLPHATTLELHAPLHERAFEGGLLTCPTFSNLTSLVLGDWVMTADFYPLHRILQLSDKLKELTLKLEMEECSTCKALPPTRRAPPSASGSYPCIERIKIYCREEHPRVDELVQALLPIAGNAKISIEWP